MLSPNLAEIGIGKNRPEPELRGERGIVPGNAFERFLPIPHKIHLVHRHDDITYAQQRTDQRVPAGLHQHALARIDKNDGQLGIRGAGRHVAGILLVPGSVRDDERTCCGGKKTPGYVDRDALLALGLQPVDQQGKIDILVDSAVTLRVFCERHKLIFEDEFRIVQQPADQGGLAVVDRTAGDEAERDPSS